MGLLNVFSSEDGKRKSHLKNLIELALADGSMDDTEMMLLKSIAAKLEMTEQDIEEIKSNPDAVKFTAPSDDQSKIEQMSDLVKMMMVNYEIEEREVKLCKALAIKLNLAPNIVDDLIDFEINGMKQDGDKDFTYKK